MTISKRDLSKIIADKHDLTQQDSLNIINSVFDEIEKLLEEGSDVNIVGFGAFKSITRPDRIATNPQTGKTFKLPSRKVVKFEMGKHLKNLFKTKKK